MEQSERFDRQHAAKMKPYHDRDKAIELLKLAAECRYIGACQECGPRIKEFLEGLNK